MKVEIDADELCELRKKAGNPIVYGTPLGVQTYKLMQKRIDDLEDERDWWRDRAYERGCNLSDIRDVVDRLDSGQLETEAKKLGYQ